MSQGPSWTDVTSAKSAIASAIAAFLSLCSAIVAISVAWHTGKQQVRLQERQLKQDLFDKRLAVYTATENWISSSIRENGLIKVGGVEYRAFMDKLQEAEWLFDRDVVDYLEEVNKTVLIQYKDAKRRDDIIDAGSDATHLIQQICGREQGFEASSKNFNEVFRPYLKLTD